MLIIPKKPWLIGNLSKKAESKWLDTVGDYGCVISRESNVDRHHVLGRTFRENNILLGPWYVLPLAKRYHYVEAIIR